MNDYSFIKDIGRSYIVSSFIPAALFVTIGTLIFIDFAPSFITGGFIENDQFYYITKWGILIIILTWVSFALYSGWHFTVQLFEGYYIKENFLGKWLTKSHKRRVKKGSRAIRKTYRLQQMDEEGLTDEIGAKIIKWQPRAKQAFLSLESWYPVSMHDKKLSWIMPTRLGNVLRSGEFYPKNKYGFDGILIWPRLVHLFPKTYSDQLEESNNKFIFLLNSAFLSWLIGLMCLAVSLIRFPCTVLNTSWLKSAYLKPYSNFFCPSTFTQSQNFFQRGFSHLDGGDYFLLGILFIALGYLIYRISVIAAVEFSKIIRSGFDLYRFELLKALHQRIPKDLDEERAIWEKICHILISGDELSRTIPELNYTQSDSEESSKEDPVKPVTPILYIFKRKKITVMKIDQN